ncbi:50S ribosomal protein 6, chloroplastic [Arachis stenosperma]|uniref:50S ribosomal protein 6, chloroplastic n=1 Tax=Arachis stenosperma TaxID=217475 RepID=UPI0025AC5809|nr:50S ribosomal protein 6, chloroplastic [Arachis stenosperma]
MSTVSSIFGGRLVVAPVSSGGSRIPIGVGGVVIECSSRPKKKATAHHIKTRPRKTQPWDIKRKPTVYPPLPPLPPEWSVVIPAADDSDTPPPPPPPLAA